MDIKNSSNPDDDVVTIRESDPYRAGLVRLEIGGKDHNPRHANLSATEAKAVAYALLSYAEQIS